MELIARRFDTTEPVRIAIANGLISSLEVIENVSTERSAELPWVAPGMIDAQCNGYAGQEFSSEKLTQEKVAAIGVQMDAFCVTRSYPTITTNAPQTMAHSLRTIAAACAASSVVARQFPGIHVEGPFLSPQNGPRGAHPLEYIREPDWDEFQRLQEAAAGMIRILTISPEYDSAPDFIRRVTDSGVVVSIGHTAATPSQIRAAVDAGASMCTHLGNGCHTMMPRHENCIWPQLADDRLTAGLIVDGHHLPPEMVKIFIRVKTTSRIVLVSDMSGLAGLPPGEYDSQLCRLEILPSGKIVVAGQELLLAAASSPLGACLANIIRCAGLSLHEAMAMAVDNPARLLHTPVPSQPLSVGSRVELVLFDLVEQPDAPFGLRFAPRATLVDDKVVFGEIPSAL